ERRAIGPRGQRERQIEPVSDVGKVSLACDVAIYEGPIAFLFRIQRETLVAHLPRIGARKGQAWDVVRRHRENHPVLQAAPRHYPLNRLPPAVREGHPCGTCTVNDLETRQDSVLCDEEARSEVEACAIRVELFDT